ncbi:GtrA family protein [Pseudarthrobacter sp. CC4]|uniref:GtrA family protein n=1 Tax=Pseudarthrobacter sp. CC4 TaxID=3029190 RepID=UPI003B8E006B
MRIPGSGMPSSNKSSAEAAPPVPRLAMVLYRHPVVRFLAVGGLSFALDLGLLAVLHEGFGVDLWIATPIAFVVSLVFNFLLQRVFTFQATNKGSVSAAKYLLLVLLNIVVSDVIVTGFDAVGWSYVLGKTTATTLTTVWNYFLYRHWIFRREPQDVETN